MRSSLRNHLRIGSAVLVAVLCGGLVLAVPVTKTRTVSGIDWASAGVGGAGCGTGTITLTGVTGPVRRAFLFWHGINNSGAGAVYNNPTVTINGNSVTGTAIGDATTNCWGSGSSRAFRADVTPYVPGNGPYLIQDMAAGAGHSGNGAALVVIFDDGNPVNNRDLVFFEGNDSNYIEGFPGEDNGWHATLNDIDYAGGSVFAQFLCADGQTNGIDSSVDFTSPSGFLSIPDSALLWDGLSVPNAGCGRGGHGLWDVHTFDVTTVFGPLGLTTLQLDGQTSANDCLGLVAVIFDLPAGSAPTSFDSPPTPACGSVFTVQADTTLAYTVQASNPLATSITLTVDAVPPGATLTPPLPTSGNPVSTAFSWTPGVADIGFTGSSTYTAVDSFGQEFTCTFSYLVVENPDTYVELAGFDALPDDHVVSVTWRTALELDNQGFYVWKRDPLFGQVTRVSDFIPALAENGGGWSYTFEDATALNGVESLYFLEDIDMSGVSTRHPFKSAVANPRNPAITLVSPEYGESWSGANALTARFAGSGSRLHLVFSGDPTFTDRERMTVVPAKRGGEVTLNDQQMDRLRTIGANSNGILYWKVIKVSGSTWQDTSQVWRFNLLAGEPVPDTGSGPGAH